VFLLQVLFRVLVLVLVLVQVRVRVRVQVQVQQLLKESMTWRSAGWDRQRCRSSSLPGR
jgi:hypothetical protein